MIDPHTHKKDKKPLKPFMVNNSVLAFEKQKIILTPRDKILLTQLEDYRIKSISSAGLPTYSSENEHAVDALNLSLLIFEQKYGDLFKYITTTRIRTFIEFNRHENFFERNTNMTETTAKAKLISSYGTSISSSSNKISRSFTGRSSPNYGYSSMKRGAF